MGTAWVLRSRSRRAFTGPRGLAIDNDGYLYVVEFGNNRVQKFTLGGDFITKWGKNEVTLQKGVRQWRIL